MATSYKIKYQYKFKKTDAGQIQVKYMNVIFLILSYFYYRCSSQFYI